LTRFPTIWHLCWFLAEKLQTTEELTLDIARRLRSAGYLVKSPYVSGILAGWIPSPFSVHERWPIIQWRSVEGFGCPTNSIVLYCNEQREVLWVADGWISDPKAKQEVIPDFAAEFNSATRPIENAHVRELASLLAFHLIEEGVYQDRITSQEDYNVVSPGPGNEVWQKWWRAIVESKDGKAGKNTTGYCCLQTLVDK
jgi:hypothetical protein